MIVTEFVVSEHLWANCIFLNVSLVLALLLYLVFSHYMFMSKEILIYQVPTL